MLSQRHCEFPRTVNLPTEQQLHGSQPRQSRSPGPQSRLASEQECYNIHGVSQAHGIHPTLYPNPTLSLLRTLFPLLSRITSAPLRSFIRNTILADVKTANLKAKNHKLNSGVQAILFTMIERGMDAEVQGDKGNIRGQKASDAMKIGSSDEAMWAVSLTKEFWSKNIWYACC